MADFVVIAIIVLCMGAILYVTVKRKKEGKSGCGCGCDHCASGTCQSGGASGHSAGQSSNRKAEL